MASLSAVSVHRVCTDGLLYFVHCNIFLDKTRVFPIIEPMLQCNISSTTALCFNQPFRKPTMINTTPEQFAAANKANLDAAQAAATKAYSGFEKLVELNMAATKAVMTESFAHAQALMEAKDPQQVMALQAGAVAPMAQKTVAYSRHVQSIVTDATSDLTKALEGKAAEGQKAMEKAMENITKNAPAGTESAVAVLKTAMATSQNAVESLQKAAKQAVSMTEASVTAATEQALKAASTVTAKA